MKWLIVIILLMIASVGSYLYRDSSLLYRIIVVFLIVILAGYLSLWTSYGRFIIVFSKEAYKEVCKVVWPTFSESVHTTMVVILVTLIISMILWALDSMLVYVVSLGLRL